MGVYIDGLDMPKHCTECYFVHRDQCVLQDNSYDYDTFKEQKKHCPLQKIDIVRCGECIWKDECILGSYGVSEQGFCYNGERRTNESNTERD